jgi:hypothetical protein
MFYKELLWNNNKFILISKQKNIAIIHIKIINQLIKVVKDK